ncbi:MAG: hypothetical protein ACI4WW_03470 [Candidatus Coprovivens sp.]
MDIANLSLDEMKKIYEVSVKRYNTLIDGINDTFSNLLYLEQFPIIAADEVDMESLDKVLSLGNNVNELESSLKEVKNTIKELVNTAIDKYDEDIMETSNSKMISRMLLVADSLDVNILNDINDKTESNIKQAIEFANGQDEETAKKLASYAAVMRIIVNERNKDILK